MQKTQPPPQVCVSSSSPVCSFYAAPICSEEKQSCGGADWGSSHQRGETQQGPGQQPCSPGTSRAGLETGQESGRPLWSLSLQDEVCSVAPSGTLLAAASHTITVTAGERHTHPGARTFPPLHTQRGAVSPERGSAMCSQDVTGYDSGTRFSESADQQFQPRTHRSVPGNPRTPTSKANPSQGS